MKKYLYLAMALSMSLSISAQLNNLNMVQLGHLPYTNNLNDVWGYTDTSGIEYALVGVTNGTSIVSLADAANPTEVAFTSGANSIWRDIKVWSHYAYVSNETSGGIKIIDLQYLPDSIQTWQWTGNNGVIFKSAHNVFMDELGYLYVIGSNYGVGGAIIANVAANPTNPIVETVYNSAYIHDLFTRGDTMWAGEIYNGWFSVVDVSNKTPAVIPLSKIIGTHSTPNTFTHNCWLSDDGNYLYSTDEQPNAYIAAYDVSNMSNIHEVDRIQSNPGSNVIPHNVFVHGNFLVASYYRDGIVVVDATHPDNLIQTGYFDTSPMAGDGFNGDWGVYPYFPSGNIIATDIEEGLFVVRPAYTQGCYLQGIVTDSITQSPINGVSVSIVGTNATDQSSLLGVYKTGIVDSGSYQVTFFKLGYEPKTLIAKLKNGIVTVLDAELKPLIPFTLSGSVRDSATGIGLDHTSVIIKGTQYNFQTTTDINGDFTFSAIYADTYDLMAGRWDHVTRVLGGLNLNQSTSGQNVLLPEGYYDDFALNFNWFVTGNASTGMWEKGVPNGTVFGSKPANPGNDIPNDLSNECYVTGNNGTGAGDDDIDNGFTLLISPYFNLLNYQDPLLDFDRWFFADGGNGNPNDSLKISLSNGSTSVLLDLAVNGDPNESKWAHKHFRISDYIQPSAQMQLRINCADRNPGHLVEAGFDGFRVSDSLYAPIADFIASPDSGCAPLIVQFSDLSINTPDQWNWSFPDNTESTSSLQNPQITFDSAGYYDVQLIVSNASGSDTLLAQQLIHVFALPEISLSSTAAGAGNNGSATANVSGGLPPYLYQWDDPAQQNTQIASNLAAGLYTVIVTDQNGCTNTDSVVVPVNSGIQVKDAQVFLEIYPNPNNGTFVIKLLTESGSSELMNWSIRNVQGQLVRQGRVMTDHGLMELHPNLQAGVYLLSIYDATGETIGQEKMLIY